MARTCLRCDARCYGDYCFRHKPRKPIQQRKPIPKKGKRQIAYEEWRDTVAKPYLDRVFGHQCVDCGATTELHVDHIKNRGSHIELKMELSNVQYLCWDCHYMKTNHLGKYAKNKEGLVS